MRVTSFWWSRAVVDLVQQASQYSEDFPMIALGGAAFGIFFLCLSIFQTFQRYRKATITKRQGAYNSFAMQVNANYPQTRWELNQSAGALNVSFTVLQTGAAIPGGARRRRRRRSGATRPRRCAWWLPWWWVRSRLRATRATSTTGPETRSLKCPTRRGAEVSWESGQLHVAVRKRAKPVVLPPEVPRLPALPRVLGLCSSVCQAPAERRETFAEGTAIAVAA
eukprot:Skav233752  [mRNA]  locus=scaffold1792:277193:289430:- [translate_table: standard]